MSWFARDLEGIWDRRKERRKGQERKGKGKEGTGKVVRVKELTGPN